jgi:hypothetical protein
VLRHQVAGGRRAERGSLVFKTMARPPVLKEISRRFANLLGANAEW